MLTLLLTMSAAVAYSDGFGSGASCAGCHTGSSAVDPCTVSATAAAATVAPGASVTVTVTVEGSGGSTSVAGFGAEASGGTLWAGLGSWRDGDELTHEAPRAFARGRASWTVLWTAPQTPGTSTISVAGVCADGDGVGSDDRAATDTLGIEVVAPCFDVDQDGVTDCAGDCDDGDRTRFPGAPETCDGYDDDCDGSTDEGATDARVWVVDADGDGFGAINVLGTRACEGPEGTSDVAGDCDDTDELVYPGAPETWYDGVDADCAGDDDEDQDGDGLPRSDDCDDVDPFVGPCAVDDTDAVDTDEPTPDDTDDPDDESPADDGGAAAGCGCAQAPVRGAWVGAVALVLGAGVRRRVSRPPAR